MKFRALPEFLVSLMSDRAHRRSSDWRGSKRIPPLPTSLPELSSGAEYFCSNLPPRGNKQAACRYWAGGRGCKDLAKERCEHDHSRDLVPHNMCKNEIRKKCKGQGCWRVHRSGDFGHKIWLTAVPERPREPTPPGVSSDDHSTPYRSGRSRSRAKRRPMADQPDEEWGLNRPFPGPPSSAPPATVVAVPTSPYPVLDLPGSLHQDLSRPMPLKVALGAVRDVATGLQKLLEVLPDHLMTTIETTTQLLSWAEKLVREYEAL